MSKGNVYEYDGDSDDGDVRVGLSPSNHLNFEYCGPIYKYLREDEVRCRLPKYYCTSIEQISVSVERHALLRRLFTCTGFFVNKNTKIGICALMLFDRYCSIASENIRNKLETLATCWLIASVLHIPPKFSHVGTFDVLHAFNIQDTTSVRRMNVHQLEIMKALKFKLHTPDVTDFTGHFIGIFQLREPMRSLYAYIIINCLTDPKCPSFLPSHLASAALLFARKMLKMPKAWTPTLEQYTGYSEKYLKPLCSHIRSFMGLVYTKDFHLLNDFASSAFKHYHRFCRKVLLAWNSRKEPPDFRYKF